VARDQRHSRRSLGLEAFENRLALSSITRFGWDLHDASAGETRQIDYWSWVNVPIPVEQLRAASNR
jgi:hypothetical protein